MKNFILILILLIIPSILLGQATSVSLGGSSSTLSMSHNTWTKVDPNLTLTANGTINGFRVQISQAYASGASGDQLRSTATLPSGVSVSAFNTTTGILIFNGTASASDWQTVLRGVEFRSTTATCYALQRRITFVAGTVFYNPLTEHFYEYVSGTTSWTNSYTNASNKSYFGRVGYLATVLSEAENNFIWKLMANDAWFGASDDYGYINTAKGSTVYASQSAAEGKWHWVTGPEKGQNFSNGNTPSTTLVSGMYHKWAGGEPNGTSEAFGQFYSSNSGQWNDLANSNLPGYICEYGDMPGDITTSTTILTRNIEISGASSGYITGGDINVCSGSNSTTLTLNSYTGSIVRWESSFDNFFTAGTTISSTSASITVTNLTKTTYYRAILNSTSPQTCSALPTSSTFLSVKPTKSGTVFAVNNSICAGGQVELTLSGQQGNVNKWQRSTNNVNWTDISNTTTSLTETISSAGTYYYRVEVQTPSCGSAVNSSSKTITVTSGTPPVGGSVSSAAHTTSTNSGTLTLSGYTGTIVKWQKSVNDGVTWTDVVNTAATYSYTNQTNGTLFRAQLTSGSCGFAYSSSGTIIVPPFTQSGYVYNSEGVGISNITVRLYTKLKSDTTYTLLSSTTTNSSGAYSFTTVLGTSKNDFRIIINSISINNPVVSDAQTFTQKVLTQSFNSKDYYRMDVNGNSILSVTDIFLIYRTINTSSLPSGIPSYRLFTQAEWNSISTSTSNLVSSYPGSQTIAITNPTSGGSSVFYLIKTGHAN